MRLVKKIILILIVGLGISCGGDDDGDVVPVVLPDATKVSLSFPENNTECNEGSFISDTHNRVVFKWGMDANNDSYTIYVKNLDSENLIPYEVPLNENELAITIIKGAPYSWWVISKVTGNPVTAKSEVWKFYNAGLPKESHPPFPAEVVSPVMGSTIESGTIKLQWEGSDIDNDIASYAVLLDTSEIPTTSIGTATTNSINVEVESGTVYYWKVISVDSAGNESNSQIFQFKVN